MADQTTNANVSDPKRKWYLLTPLLIFLFAFVLDKQFFIWRFPDSFLRTASFISYEHKDSMLLELKDYLGQSDRKKVIVMFGNSRTTHFDNAYIEKNWPEYILFNFSVPGGTPDYYLYILEKFRDHHIRPDYIFFAVTPQGFHARPSIAMDEVMLEGLSPGFVARKALNYKADHITNYVAKKLFWIYQYRPKLNVILSRWKNDANDIRIFRSFLATERVQLSEQRGSISPAYQSKPAQDPDFLKMTADGTWRDFFANFEINEGQISFLEQALEITQQMQIPNSMVWVKVGPNLREYKNSRKIVKLAGKKMTIREFFVPMCEKMAKQYDSDFLDLNYEYRSKCDLFSDSSHMAAYCFGEFTDIIFNRMKTRNPDQ